MKHWILIFTVGIEFNESKVRQVEFKCNKQLALLKR